MGIGKRLRELREREGLTQEELGKIINQKKSNISKYENGKLQPSLETIESLLGFFGVSPNYFFNYTPHAEHNEKNKTAYFKLVNQIPEEKRKLIEKLLEFNDNDYKKIEAIAEVFIQIDRSKNEQAAAMGS